MLSSNRLSRVGLDEHLLDPHGIGEAPNVEDRRLKFKHHSTIRPLQPRPIDLEIITRSNHHIPVAYRYEKSQASRKASGPLIYSVDIARTPGAND